MTLRVTIFRNDQMNARSSEIHDQFTVPGDVVEIITSPSCEMTFVLADGSRIESTDIADDNGQAAEPFGELSGIPKKDPATAEPGSRMAGRGPATLLSQTRIKSIYRGAGRAAGPREAKEATS